MKTILNKRIIGLFFSLSIMICSAFIVSSVNVSNTEARGISGEVSISGARSITSRALNDKGQVAGEFTDLYGRVKAFLYNWKSNTARRLSTPINSWSHASDVNNNGMAVGDIDVRPVVWYPNGSPKNLIAPAGAGMAYAINDNSNIVGYMNSIAYYWPSPTSAGTFLMTPGKYSSDAYSINNNKWIVGYYLRYGSEYRACLWKGPTSSITDLGTLPGAIHSYAYCINNKNQVVGLSGDQAFIWENGQMRGLGISGYDSTCASAINDDGMITGYYSKNGVTGMFTWQNGKFTDLGKFSIKGIDINKYGTILTVDNKIFCQ